MNKVFGLLLLLALTSGCNIDEEKAVSEFNEKYPFNPDLEAEISNIPKVGETMTVNMTLYPRNEYDDYVFLYFYWEYVSGGNSQFFSPTKGEYYENGSTKSVSGFVTYKTEVPLVDGIRFCARRPTPVSGLSTDYFVSKCLPPIYMSIGENHSYIIVKE